MADQLNMNGLNLGPDGPPGTGRSYIPPHMRGKMGPPSAQGPPAMAGGPPPGPPMAGGLNNSAWAG